MKTLLTLFAIATALAACTPPRPPTQQEKLQQFVHCFREEMQPTDDQVNQLQGKILGDDKDIKIVDESFRKATDALETQLENPAASDAELLPLYRKVAGIRAQLQEDHFRRMLQLRNILTPEQKKKFLACKRKLAPPTPPQE
jgi:Spy/CpxP family protein refolding chaperone